MAPDTDTVSRLSRYVPLDQLTMPDVDVRDRRPEDDVRGIAASLGDPDVGQLQPILVTPDTDDEGVSEWGRDRLSEWVDSGEPLQIIDGVTRYMAADYLEWDRLWTWVVADPPRNRVVAQLDANTERIQMTQFETVSALAQHKEDTGASVKELAGKVGYSPSYMSSVLNALDGPEWLVEAWRHPDHPLDTSHALAVYSMLSDNSIRAYQEAGDLDRDEARQLAVEDAQLMVNVQGQHDLQVGDFRQRCKRCRKETLNQLKDKRNLNQKQADGQTKAADRQHSPAQDPAVCDCTLCGTERNHERRYALHVCPGCYGMLSDIEANDETLMQTDKEIVNPMESPDLDDVDPVQAAGVVLEAVGIDDLEPQALLEELARSAQAHGEVQEADAQD